MSSSASSTLASAGMPLAASHSLSVAASVEAAQAAAAGSSSAGGVNINNHGPHPPLPAPGTSIKRRAGGQAANKRVSYYYDSDIGAFSYGYQHPMKPHRMRMAHNLIQAYGLDKHMDVHRPKRASPSELTRFHTDEYIHFLRMVTPETVAILTGDSARHLAGAGEDCPAFEGLWDFCTISAGGSIGAAHQVTSGNSDISINWAGGLHHAKKREASGFCYVNDIVLCILELLRVHTRVLYIDIDVHHGDGVEEAFYSTDRVLTASFHKFGDFFPGTGDVKDIGMKGGKGYSVNVPLKDGISEEAYMDIFRPVISHIMDWYQPGAVVLQCGADSLAGDKLGCFNLSMRGHAACVDFMAAYNVPLVILGGGGYTVRNVARTWTYETGSVLGVDLSQDLPYNAYMSYFGPDYKLDVPRNSMEDYNSREYLEDIKAQIIDNLRMLPSAPSAPMQEIPRGPLFGVGRRGEDELSNDEDSDLDTRITQRIKDAHVQRYGDELSDGEYDFGGFYGVGPNPPNRPRLIPRGYEDESDDGDDDVVYDERIHDRASASSSVGGRRGVSTSPIQGRTSKRGKEIQRAQALLPPVWRPNSHSHPDDDGSGAEGPSTGAAFSASGSPSTSRVSSQAHAWNADPSAIVRAFPYHNPYSRHRPKRSFFSSSAPRPSASLAEVRSVLEAHQVQQQLQRRRAALAAGAGSSLGRGLGAGRQSGRNGLHGHGEDDDGDALMSGLEDSGGGAPRRGSTAHFGDYDILSRRTSYDSLHRRAGGGGGGLTNGEASSGYAPNGGGGYGKNGTAGTSGNTSSRTRDRAKERERKTAREREWERAREWRVA